MASILKTKFEFKLFRIYQELNQVSNIWEQQARQFYYTFAKRPMKLSQSNHSQNIVVFQEDDAAEE